MTPAMEPVLAGDGNEQERAAQAKRQRTRSIAIALVLALLVLLFYAATIVHMGGHVMDRPI